MNQNYNSNSISAFDMLAVFSVLLQIMGYQNDVSQSTNDDLMKELQSQDRRYLDKIIQTQNEILNILSELKKDMSAYK